MSRKRKSDEELRLLFEGLAESIFLILDPETPMKMEQVLNKFIELLDCITKVSEPNA